MKKISVRGYKAIKNTKEFRLAPINLLIGPNGSAKSSLINALVLSKNIIEKDKISDRYKFSEHLKNPYNEIGRFSKRDINYNQKKNEFSFSFAFNLYHFKDKFELELVYYLNQNNVAALKSIKIINLNRKSIFFSIEAVNIIEKSKKIKNPHVFSYDGFDSIIKIDIDYIINFIKSKNSNSKRSNLDLNSTIEKLLIEQEFLPDEIINESKEILSKIEEEDIEKNSAELNKLTTVFNQTNFCELKNNYDQAIISQLRNHESEKIDFKKLVNIQFFDFYEVIINDEEEIDIYNKKYELTQKFEKNWLYNLKHVGIRNSFGAFSIAEIFNSFINKPCNEIFRENSKISFNDENKTEKNEINEVTLNSLSITKKFSSASEIIFQKLIFQNIFDSLDNLHENIDKINYISPIRVKNYKAFNSINNENYLTVFANKINQLQIKDHSQTHITFFINYWAKQLNLNKKLKLDSFDDLIDLFTSNKTNFDLSELGYGIGQLFPLICFLPFFNENYGFSDVDLFADIDRSFISSNFNKGNCFIIEEPEANLHPNFQSKLADIFIDAAWKFDHQFIIETHSEYMVRKFQYWVAKGKIKPSDVNIYYFDNKNDDPEIKDVIIKKISINKDGSLSEPFGEGFYDEATNLQFDLLKIKNIQNN